MKYRLSVSILVTVFWAVSAACQNRATTAQEQNQEPNTNRRVRISVVLPKVVYAAPAPDIFSNGSTILSILPDSRQEDTFYIGNDPVVESNITRKISALFRGKPPDQQTVYVSSFKTVEYGDLLSVLGRVREAGVERIGLIVERERQNELGVLDIKIAKKSGPTAQVTRAPNPGARKTTRNPVDQPPSPKADSGAVGSLLVEIMPGGAGLDQRVRINGKIVELTEAAPAIQTILNQQPAGGASVKAPADKMYADVVYVIDAVKGAGAQAIEIQIDPVDSTRRARKSAGVSSGGTPLIGAVKKDDLGAVQALLAKGADVNAADHKDRTPLLYAAQWGHTEIARALLAKGAGQLNEALYLSSRAEIAEMLLAKGADVNAKDEGGYTLLINAAMKGDLEKVRVLLAHGADVGARNKNGSTALLAAAYDGSVEVFQALLAKGADANTKDNEGRDTVIYAARENHPRLLRVLIDSGAEVNVKDNEGQTPLMFAAQYNSLGAAQLLLSRGADVNAKDRQGRTALIYAVGLQEVKINPELIQALLAKGADVNARDQAGKTALGYAVEKEIGDRAPEAVELLRKSGAKE